MEINRISPRRVQVVLSGEDLSAMHLSYETLDYHSPETRKMILSLLETACLATDFMPESRVFIEVYPSEEGGCTLYFSDLDAARAREQTQTQTPKRWRVRKRAALPVIYCFDDIDTLIAGSVKLFRRCSHRILKSALYKMQDSWRVIIYPLDTLENITLSFLDEFAPRCGEGILAAAWVREHGEALVEENAIDLISSYFG